MRRNAVTAALARLGASLALLAGLCGQALAGDRAYIDFIGFSADGRYFAFEEYGQQDGSGFPYSNIYVVDLPSDSWVKGSPFRVRIDDEAVPIAQARRQAADAAAKLIGSLKIDAPVDIVALNADGEPGTATELTFGMPGYAPNEPLGLYQLVLDIFPAKSPEPCEDYLGEPAKGFALTFIANEVEHEITRDKTLPASRGCPTTYRIYAVVAPPFLQPPESYVAIIASYPHGFEGPDRRFIAVPLGH